MTRAGWWLANCSLIATLSAPGPAIWAQDEPGVPAPRGFISDYAGVVSGATVEELTGLIGELREKTGAEIAVVVVRTVKPLSSFDYAMKIAEAWKVGSKKHDNGVVFLVAVDDRDLYILTGYGVEGALPDGLVGEIRDTLVIPAFRNGDYNGGIRAATVRMADLIAADRGVQLTGGGPRPPPPARRRAPGRSLSWPVLILIVALFLVLGSQGHRFSGGRRGRRRRSAPFIVGGLGGGGFGGFGGGFGGFGGGGGGGGFGGFGGGGFGGGGAGGQW